MARGTRKKDFDYEVDTTATDGTVSIAARMLISMDQYNTGTADTKIKEPSGSEIKIPAHVSLNLNEKEYGIHPRYAYCEYADAVETAACYGVTPKRNVSIPILTLEQFGDLNVYDFKAGGTQTKTTLVINHSFDGSAGLTYKIKKLVNQVNL